MRIIGGKHKGRKLHPPRGLKARPTMDITKESLLNALKSRYFLNEIDVLDLFAGTGNIALEFASRGAAHITAVDSQAAAVRFIRKTAEDWNLPVEVIQADVFDFLQQPAYRSFDVIYADPPYGLEQADFERLIDLVFENQWLAPDGLLVVEHHRTMRFDRHPRYVRSRRYGQSVLSFFA